MSKIKVLFLVFMIVAVYGCSKECKNDFKVKEADIIKIKSSYIHNINEKGENVYVMKKSDVEYLKYLTNWEQ